MTSSDEEDDVDRLMAQWAGERPDLDHTVMATVGRLVRVAQLVDRRFEAEAARHGLTRADADVLFTLRRAGPPYRLLPSRLASALLVPSGTMTARLDRLEAKGLVERRPNPQDRRSVEVGLTAEGHDVTERGVTEHVADEAALLAVLSERERRGLDAALRKLLAHVAALPPPGG